MNGEVYKIEIPVEVQDRTNPGMNQAQANVQKLEQRMTKYEKSVDRVQKRFEKMNKTRVRTVLEAIDRASPIISKIGGAARSLARSPFKLTIRAVDMATSPLRAVYRYATSIRGIMTGLIAGAAANKLTAGPVALADSLTNAEIGFETMLKSAEKAKAMIADIKEFAIKTPFETQDVIQGTQRMMTMGWAAKDVLRDMERIGNAAAATGKGSEGMDRIVLALGQMKMKGKVSAEEINQLAEAGVRAREYIAKGLGVDVPKAMAMMEKGTIKSAQAVELILKGMEEFDGMMDKTANRTVSGLKSQIMDAFSVNIVEKWGSGLQSGMINGLSKLNSWLGANRKMLTFIGDQVGDIGASLSNNVVKVVEMLGKRAAGAFKDMQKLGDEVSGAAKAKFLWDRIISEPFAEWWGGKGRERTLAIAKDFGNTLGGGIGGFLAGALGIAADSAGGASSSPFLQAGTTAGTAFFDAFWNAFDADKLAQKAADAFSGMASSAGKIAPGGQEATGSSYISALIMGALALKGGKGAFKLFKGGKGAWNAVKGIKGVTTAAKGATTAASMADEVAEVVGATVSATSKGSRFGFLKNIPGMFKKGAKAIPSAPNSTLSMPAGADFWETANLKNVSKRTDIVNMANAGKLGRYDELLDVFGGASKGAGLLGKAGGVLSKGGKALKGVPLLGLALGGLAIAGAEDKKRETVAQVGGGLGGWGGAAAGAAAGAAIGSVVPVLGTAIGGAIGMAIGGLGGSFLGDFVGRSIYDTATKSNNNNKAYAGHGLPNKATTYPQGKNQGQKPEQNITVHVQASPQFSIQAATSADEVMKVIRGNIGALTDEIADEISKGLVKTFGNMPMKAVEVG